ncbi:MAG: alpha/beta fold hydrolase [Kofleriaceae bacterium]
MLRIRFTAALAVILVILVILVVPTAGAAPGKVIKRKAGEVELSRGTLALASGQTLAFELGTLYVPENRTAPGSRIIGVGFARLKAARPTGAPPIFMLPGGPGVSYLDAFVTGVADDWLAHVTPYLSAGDVIVVDQRGFSKRGDVLLATAPRFPLDQASTSAANAASDIALARQAIAAHRDKDLAGYTIVQLAADVDDLRKALGYRQITLSGQSFGSQWAFAVMRLYPQTVARALLSGVEPLDAAYDLPAHVIAAVQRIAWDGDRDPGLAPYLPTGGVMAAIRAVHDRLVRAPITITVAAAAGGKPQTVTLGLADFQKWLLRSGRTLPAYVLSLYHRRYDDWAREVIDWRQHAEPVELIQPLIDTSLGVPATREHQLRTDPAADLLGDHDFAPQLASASTWPTQDVGAKLHAPVQSPIPVLFIHGDWDTSTPIDNTFAILPYFPNGRALIVRRAGHHSRGQLFAQRADVLKQVNAFLASGSTQGLPTEVTLAAPAFELPAFPAPRP